MNPLGIGAWCNHEVVFQFVGVSEEDEVDGLYTLATFIPRY